MKTVNFRIIQSIALIWLIIFSLESRGQMPMIPSSTISQIANMSASERQNLAAQYGVNINDLGLSDISGGGDDQLGTSSGPITSDANEIIYQRIIQAEENNNKTREYRRRSIPIFEREYSSIQDLPTYGQFLFDGNYSTFSPVDNAPVPNNYVLGPGDSIKVLMYGINDTEIELIVSREGTINFPELGSISLAGMTFLEATEYIKDRVSKQMIGVEISISIGQLRSIDVFLTGEAMIPGVYAVSGLSTVSQLLFVAGGVTDIGSLRNIEIRRSNKLINTFDLYDLLTKGSAKDDIRLQSGDVIFVPTIRKSAILDGAVRRPGKYELKDNEDISELFNLAGGLNSRAYKKQIQIERFDHSNELPSIINLDMTDRDNAEYEIIDGDIIRIAEISDAKNNSVVLKGAIRRPGHYGWYENMRFSDVISSINDFSDNFDMNKAIIVRRKNNSNFYVEAIGFNIKNALESPKSEEDPILKLHDEVLIFSLGYNADILNDEQIYSSQEDPYHPLYGKEESTENLSNEQIPSQTQSPETSLNLMVQNQRFDQEERRVEMYNLKKIEEYNLLNKGKRRLLLQPLNSILRQQASSSEPPELVSISGAVKVPGDYPLIRDASYMDLIELAGGYKDNAFIEAAEIRRTIMDSSGSMIIDTSDIDLRQLSSTRLKSRDHIHVRSVKDWDVRDTVILSGEIFYPGSYLISPNETLSSVIKRAGGFTSESFIEGAIFTRESIKEKEREQLQILGDTIRRDQAARSMTKESEDFSVSSSEVEASISALLDSAVYGRLIIDIPRLMSGDSDADIVLQDGDELIIPKFTNAVTVVGEVRRAGSFVMQNDYIIDDYLSLAAGMTARGDQSEIYIIKADGSVNKNIKKRSLLVFDDGGNQIEAGDTIVVPIRSNYQTPLNLYSTVSQVVFQSIASIAAFSTIFD